MPCNTKSTVRRSGMEQVACSALVALVCLALASCGGGPGAVLPDLVVEAPAVSDPRPAAGAGFTFSASVRNAGRGNAAAATLRVYRSDDEAITPSDEEVGATTVAGLAASASRAASVKVTAPSSPGVSYYGACVDPVAGESDTANTCSAAVRVDVQAQHLEPASPQPDLVVELPAVNDDSPAAGASFSFSATVRNAGDADAAATTLRVYRSDDATITPSDEHVGAAAVPELAASKSSPASVELTAPSSSGTYYYGACVHAVAEESDTANNCSEAVQVTVQAAQVPASGPPRPDLVVDRVGVSPGSPPVGGLFDLWAEVRNRGGAPAPYTKLRFYLSTDATVSRSDTELATRWTYLGIESHDKEGYDRVFVKAPSSKGVYYYGACLDVAPGESDTANNCSAAVKAEVSLYIPDLIVGAWSARSPKPVGESLSQGTAVWNEGSPSEATKLRLLLLPDRTSEPSAGTRVGEVDVPELVLTHHWPTVSVWYVKFRAPATVGWYYYVMCVDAVRGESNTANNCSTVTAIEFR